ncbi:MAG TPA: DNA-binding protein [Candidatus Berkiella sp.]|nr:DNA-binding protein [Candidatus Berkiella sp.]
MGRIGVSFEEVASAAFKLQGAGKSATVDAVREMLGTGSKTTINQHLKEWKAAQTEATPCLPPALAQLVTGLWERMQSEAEEKILTANTIHAAERDNFQLTLINMEQSLNIATQHLNEMTERYQTECKRVEQLEMDFRQIKQAFGQLQERHEAMNNQLSDSKIENTRLHQLASQIQTNLEHYQQAMEELRTKQMLENEQRQTDFEHQLSLHREEIKRLMQERASQNQEIIVLQQMATQSASQHKKEQQHLHERNQHLEQLLVEKGAIEQKAEKRIHALEQQLDILLNQNERLQSHVEQANEKQTTLQQELKHLVTENHQLQMLLSQAKHEEQREVTPSS